MKEFKLNWRFWFFVMFLIAVCLFGAAAVSMLLKNEVALEEGPMPPVLSWFLAVLISVVLLSYLYSSIVMLWQTFRHEGLGLTLTPAGIENSVVYINLLAFIIVAPVKLIPWEAIHYTDFDEKTPYVRVRIRKVDAGFPAKAILFIMGYHFCRGFVRPCVTVEDIQKYQHKFEKNPD